MIKIFCLFFLFCSSAWAASPLAKKYPEALLTDDHGILKEKDITSDLPDEMVPYNVNEDQSGISRWQCFSLRDVKPKIEKWKGVDGAGPDKIVTMCDLHILVDGKELWHDYFEPRAWNSNHCLEFMKTWIRLTKNEEFVCFSGAPFLLEKQKVGGVDRMVKLWQWSKYKTKKGCDSYHEGGCG